MNIGIDDEGITAISKNHLQLMIQFIASKHPMTKVSFCKQPPKEYSREEITQILKENHNETVGHLQGNISKSESPILMKFGIIVVFEKIFDTYLFFIGNG